ncbi:MAG: NAD-binding protein [Betaproteobacteria bacterium]|nr:NAD-binding protein [Betaproteobacteria bacterium]
MATRGRKTAGARARKAAVARSRSEAPVGIVGLGIMGGGMAQALLGAGRAVVGYDPDRAARTRLQRAGGRALATATAVAQQADVVITSLATVAALDDVVAKLAAARRPSGRAPLVVVESSTLPLADKDRAHDRLARAGAIAMDCPISGTAVRLQERAWTIYASGPRSAYRRVRPIFSVFTDNAPYVGRFGHGTRMKFVANHLVAILNVATAESLTYARRLGLDPELVHKLVATSPIIGTGVYRLRGRFMVDRSYRPATMKVEVWQKDMQVIGDMARAVGAPVPLFSNCAALYNAAMALGLAQSDSASVCEVFDAMTGGGTRGWRIRGRSKSMRG